MKDKIHNLWQQLRRWMFPDGWAIFRFCFSLVALVFGLLKLSVQLADYFKWTRSTAPLTQIHWYLWASFLSTVFVVCFTWALYDRFWVLKVGLQQKLDDATKQLDDAQKIIDDTRKLTGVASGILHAMAEVVRSCAIRDDNSEPLDMDKHPVLRDLLNKRVSAYLKTIIGDANISIVVKYAEADNYGKLKLVSKFKALGDEQDVGHRKEEMKLEESIVYTRFKQADRTLRRVIIRDVRELDSNVTTPLGSTAANANHQYKRYAELCGFRSLLAFPLREPHNPSDSGLYRTVGVKGFLSFDCTRPNAFDRLFVQRQGAPESNDGNHFDDSEHLQLFFGLADGISTIAMLEEQRAARPRGVRNSFIRNELASLSDNGEEKNHG